MRQLAMHGVLGGPDCGQASAAFDAHAALGEVVVEDRFDPSLWDGEQERERLVAPAAVLRHRNGGVATLGMDCNGGAGIAGIDKASG